MSLPLSQIVNVQLNTIPNAPARQSLDTMALFSYEKGNVFTDSATKYIECTNQQDVETAFGTNSETASATRPFFAQSPRPKRLFIVRWLKEAFDLAAAEAKVKGAPITATVESFKAITNGYLSFVANGTNVDIKEVDLSSVLSLEDVVTTINAALPSNAVFRMTFDATGNRALVSTKSAGADKKLSYAIDNKLTGSYLGQLLKLEDGQADKQDGADAETLAKQTLPESFAAFLDMKQDWYAASVIGALTDEQILAASNWIQAADKRVFGYTTLRASHIENVSGNVFKKLYDQQNYRTFVMYDKDDQYSHMSALSRALAVNFNANNSLITLKFKVLPTISAENLTLTEASKCKALGINYYAYYDTAAMLAEGMVIGGRFFDEIHGLDWYCDAVQKETFAVFYQSGTKVSQTDKGMQRLIAAVNRVGEEGLKNGLLAPGVWKGDGFGNLETGDYLESGYYAWADTVDNQSTSDRDNRVAVPIQNALKLAGAIHSLDVIVNFNR